MGGRECSSDREVQGEKNGEVQRKTKRRSAGIEATKSGDGTTKCMRRRAAKCVDNSRIVSLYWLTTERLGLRRFAEDDLDWLCEFYGDPDITRYLGGLKTRAQVAELLQTRAFDYYEHHPGLGSWMTVERATSRPVGFHVLNHIQGESIIQVGFGLVKDAWGQGFAAEMAAALLRHGFSSLQLPLITALTNIENIASQRVLTKIGLERRGERSFTHPQIAAEGPMAWFEREREDWLAERQT